MINPTWRLATQEAALLTPAEEAALELIGRLPLAAVSHLLPLASGRSRSAPCSDVVRLAERGLVATIQARRTAPVGGAGSCSSATWVWRCSHVERPWIPVSWLAVGDYG